jgi:hypothetical protein
MRHGLIKAVLLVFSCVVVIAFGLFVIARSHTASNSSERVFDLSGGSLEKVGWPSDNPGGVWEMDNPGPVKILLPNGMKLSGSPLCMIFTRDANSFGIQYTAPGERLSDAYQLAINYCHQFGVPTQRIDEWRAQTDHFREPHCDSSYWNSDKSDIGVEIWHVLPSPKEYAVSVGFGWGPKTKNPMEDTSQPK